MLVVWWPVWVPPGGHTTTTKEEERSIIIGSVGSVGTLNPGASGEVS